MADLLSGLHDDHGRVTMQGFYDKVLPLEQEERDELSRLPLGDDLYLEPSRRTQIVGREKATPLSNASVPGQPWKLMDFIPASSVRGKRPFYQPMQWQRFLLALVPDQDPNEIYELLKPI